jgi:thymidylate kinase
MLIVLEGCDGSGKTTVANQLKNVIPDAEIIHCTRITENTFDFFLRIIESSKTRNIIADRFCYGQFVYQDSSERSLTLQQLHRLEIQMVKTGARVIHVSASSSEINTRLMLRHELPSFPVEDILHSYSILFSDISLIKPYIWWTGGEQ